MSQIYTTVEVVNANDLALLDNGIIPEQNVRRMNLHLLVDTGSHFLCINEEIAHQMGFKTFAVTPM